MYSSGMSERVLDVKRLQHLIKVSVIILSLASLVVALLNYKNLSSVSTAYIKEHRECVATLGNTPEAIVSCGGWMEAVNKQSDRVFYGVVIGLGLPIVFFGSKILVEYLAPRKSQG